MRKYQLRSLFEWCIAIPAYEIWNFVGYNDWSKLEECTAKGVCSWRIKSNVNDFIAYGKYTSPYSVPIESYIYDFNDRLLDYVSYDKSYCFVSVFQRRNLFNIDCHAFPDLHNWCRWSTIQLGDFPPMFVIPNTSSGDPRIAINKYYYSETRRRFLAILKGYPAGGKFLASIGLYLFTTLLNTNNNTIVPRPDKSAYYSIIRFVPFSTWEIYQQDAIRFDQYGNPIAWSDWYLQYHNGFLSNNVIVEDMSDYHASLRPFVRRHAPSGRQTMVEYAIFYPTSFFKEGVDEVV